MYLSADDLSDQSVLPTTASDVSATTGAGVALHQIAASITSRLSQSRSYIQTEQAFLHTRTADGWPLVGRIPGTRQSKCPRIKIVANISLEQNRRDKKWLRRDWAWVLGGARRTRNGGGNCHADFEGNCAGLCVGARAGAIHIACGARRMTRRVECSALKST